MNESPPEIGAPAPGPENDEPAPVSKPTVASAVAAASAEKAPADPASDAGPTGDAGLSSGSRRRALLRRMAGLAVTGAALYVVAPTVLSVLNSFPQLKSVDPIWFAIVTLLQVATFAGTWYLFRFALRTKRWFPIITAQLAGNAVSRVLPGGVAAGPALQAAMLTRSGFPGVVAATAMSSTGLLLTGALLMLPLLALPAVLAGLSLPRELEYGLALSLILAVLIAAVGILLLRTDGILRLAGRAATWVTTTLLRRPGNAKALTARLLKERDEVRASFARNPYRALVIAAVTRLLDYATLVAALLAVGVDTSPTLVLLAFVASAALSMVPITPGGIGFVEAGLTGVLALAGVPANEALLGTLLYRLASYWLPLPVGLVAYLYWHQKAGADRRRHVPTPAPGAPAS
jgi:uncharacterized protein (TIRG00374 family)